MTRPNLRLSRGPSRTPSPTETPRERRGFTLVELLVVIVILAILVGLLVPVLSGAVNRANDAQVKADIENLANALARFQTEYGDLPPSRILLSENGFYPTGSNVALAGVSNWLIRQGTPVSAPVAGALDPGYFGSTDLTLGQLAERSQRYLKKFFPKAQPPTGSGPTGFHDFNGNGILDAGSMAPGDAYFIYLQGHECLAFFLGGIPDQSSETTAMSGFHRNPTTPFLSVAQSFAVSATGTGNRKPALFEFASDRLADDDFDGIPGYVDAMATGNASDQRYFAYFSAYGNGQYDPNDVNLPESIGGGITGGYSVPYLGLLGGTVSVAPNPYTSGPPISTPAARPPAWINANTYQIIASGRDRFYGPGGQYSGASNAERLPVNSGRTAAGRLLEADNLTNFAANRLD